MMYSPDKMMGSKGLHGTPISAPGCFPSGRYSPPPYRTAPDPMPPPPRRCMPNPTVSFYFSCKSWRWFFFSWQINQSYFFDKVKFYIAIVEGNFSTTIWRISLINASKTLNGKSYQIDESFFTPRSFVGVRKISFNSLLL